MKLVFAILGGALAIDYLTSTSSNTDTSTTSYPPATYMVWTTATVAGASTAYQVAFSQSFSQLWSTLATPKSGSIGLGTIEGTVGTYRGVGEVMPASGEVSGSGDSASASVTATASSTASASAAASATASTA